MQRGLYIAASGMLAEMVRQNQIANDLANSSTPGYKPDRAAQRSFGELLLRNGGSGAEVGTLGLGTQIDEIRTDLAPAPIRDSGEPLDFAIEGDGWFGIRTPEGVRFTRNGQFTADSGGRLVDQLGNAVLGRDGGDVTVGESGRVRPGAVGAFAVDGARKLGDSLFTGAQTGAASGTVRGGALEGSGADPARSMVDMIASFRALEAGQKAIHTIDETLGRSAGQVGSLG
jgi:flagellar basal-body rod protein FlgG